MLHRRIFLIGLLVSGSFQTSAQSQIPPTLRLELVVAGQRNCVLSGDMAIASLRVIARFHNDSDHPVTLIGAERLRPVFARQVAKLKTGAYDVNYGNGTFWDTSQKRYDIPARSMIELREKKDMPFYLGSENASDMLMPGQRYYFQLRTHELRSVYGSSASPIGVTLHSNEAVIDTPPKESPLAPLAECDDPAWATF